MEEKAKENIIIKDINALSKESISLIATIALGSLLVVPAFMAILASFKRSIDYTMMIYLAMIKNFVFPFACSLIFLIYLILIIRLQKRGADLKVIFKHNPLFVVFALMVLWMVASQFYNGADYAFSSFAVDTLGETFGMELSYIAFIMFGATQVKVESHKRWLIRIEVFSSIILVLAAFILWQTQTESNLFVDWEPRFSSIFSNRNYYGYYLSVSVPITGASFVYEKKIKWKAISGISFIANTVALSLADTLGAWFGAGLAVLFIVIVHIIVDKKINIYALVLIPVYCICLFIPGNITGKFESNFSSLSTDIVNIVTGDENADHAGSGRWSLWKDSLEIVKDNPIYGLGFEGAMFLEADECPANVRPHNEFIQYAMFHGIPTVLLYFIGCSGIFIRALRKRKMINGSTLVSLSGAFGYLVGSFFGLTVFSTAYLMFVFLGMGYVSENGDF